MRHPTAAVVLLALSEPRAGPGADGGADAGRDAEARSPDYEGRPPAPTTAANDVRWVPRIVFFPLWLTSEYVLRVPIGAFLVTAERKNWPASLYDFFAFGPDHKAGFAPLVLADFGFNPSVGVYAFWDDAGFKGHDLSVHAATWGQDWIAGSVTERFKLASKKVLTLMLEGVRRPDHVYFGQGRAPFSRTRAATARISSTDT